VDDSGEHPEERRHQQPGRRSSDADAFTVAAHAAGEDWLFPRWTVGRATKWLTLISLVIGVYAAISAFVATKIATRQEIGVAIDSVKTDVKALRGSTEVRLTRIEARQDSAEAIRSLLIPMARLQCLQMREWKSGTLAEAAGLPCDELLRRPH
jgi:hypothetical protein